MPESENGQAADKQVSNGSSSAVTSNGSAHVKKTSDMAIYEQFRSQVVNLVRCVVKFVMV